MKKEEIIDDEFEENENCKKIRDKEGWFFGWCKTKNKLEWWSYNDNENSLNILPHDNGEYWVFHNKSSISGSPYATLWVA